MCLCTPLVVLIDFIQKHGGVLSFQIVTRDSCFIQGPTSITGILDTFPWQLADIFTYRSVLYDFQLSTIILVFTFFISVRIQTYSPPYFWGVSSQSVVWHLWSLGVLRPIQKDYGIKTIFIYSPRSVK